MNATEFIPRMTPAFPKVAAVVLLVSWFVIPGAPAASGGGEAGGKANPHAGIPCSDCHGKVAERGKTAWRDIAAELVKEPVALCRGCHPTSEVNHHPVGLKTERPLPEGLPLGLAGEVICSTCHDVHLPDARSTLLRGYDTGRYSVRMDMCLDCHGHGFGAINPHRVVTGEDRCYTCHATTPVGGDTSSTVVFKRDMSGICNFCHNVSAKAHPSNVDPLRKLPASLPRSRDGEVNCGSCHDPHGADVTLHFLRKKYMDFLEAGRYQNPHGAKDYTSCQGCHNDVSTKAETMRKNLRYGGDALQICLSCHGAMDACHPILVKPTAAMTGIGDLPLSAEGKITCLTCHDPMPAGKSGVAVRGRTSGEAVNAICFRCHDKRDLANRNPHGAMTDRESCKFCHDTMTDPRNEEASRVSFISNTRLICLRCHAQEFHPAGANHMVVPKMTVPEPFRLDGKGSMTCTTCHNPHIDTAASDPGNGRRRFAGNADAKTFCSLCHRR